MNRFATEHTDWTDRLSDFMDGALGSAEHTEVEDHLSGCGACRRTLEELRAVASRAAELGPVEPSRDLWGGIAATIEAPVAPKTAGAQVIELPTAGQRRNHGTTRGRDLEEALAPRRFVLSSRQLAAASLALVAATSFVTWSLRGVSAPEQAAVDAVPGGVIMPTSQI
ncbi:MAG: zf-HC2 domain-containing protein, partial [Gemmatimonadetes bacterium]|nr:zf-HC2 domain-containing protein [Gemmatimonadota bacterium]